MGINKVNIYNDLMRGACDNILSCNLSGNGAYQLWSKLKQGYKAALSSAIVICGAANHAWNVQSAGIGTFQEKVHPLVAIELQKTNL